jgi:chaperone LolA
MAMLPMALAVHAAERDDGLELLNDFVENVRTMSARFEQSLVDADDNVVETSHGTMELMRPGRFRWSYSDPYEQILVADGLNVWNYDVDLAQVTVKAQADVLGSTPALLFGGSDNVLEDFDYAGSFTERDTIWVRLRPRDSDSGFTRIELGFDQRRLTRMIFLDTLEQSTLIALYDVTINEAIAESRFAFEPPDDADLVGTPLTVDHADM